MAEVTGPITHREKQSKGLSLSLGLGLHNQQLNKNVSKYRD